MLLAAVFWKGVVWHGQRLLLRGHSQKEDEGGGGGRRGAEVKGQKDDAPVGRGRAWSVSARLASSTPHTHRPPERGVRGTHIYHWGTAVGLPATGHSSPLHARAHPHTRTHCKNTTLVLCTLEPRSIGVSCKSWACDRYCSDVVSTLFL